MTLRPEGSRIAVWVDQKNDTGSDLAEEICPGVLRIRGDGDPHLYAHEDGKVYGAGLNGIVVVPVDQEAQVVEAADMQPMENIHPEYVELNTSGEIVAIFDLDKGFIPFFPQRDEAFSV